MSLNNVLKLLFVYLIILGFLSLNPWIQPGSGKVIGFVAKDMAAHAAAYGGLSLLMLISLRKWQRPLIVVMFVVLVSCSAIGVFFEYCQSWFTSSRQFSFHDIAANVFGSMLGLLCFGLFRFSRVIANVL